MSTSAQVRAAIMSMLTGINGLPKPVAERISSPQEEDVPAISIYLPSEAADQKHDQFEEMVTTRIQIECNVYRGDRYIADLEAMRELIKSKLVTDRTLGGVTDSCDYKGSAFDLGGVSEVNVARLTLNYDAVYIWTPTITADAFTTLNLEIDMASPRNDPPNPTKPDGQIDASATIELTQ